MYMHRNQNGVALVVALVMLSVIALVAGVMLRNVAQQEKLSAATISVSKAQFAAELGLRDAILRITAVEGTPNKIVGPVLTSPQALSVFATGSYDGYASTPPDDYQFDYTVEYKLVTNPTTNISVPITNDRGQAVYVVKAEGRSGVARRRVEIGIIDNFRSSPFGFGLIGCEGVWLEAAAETRSLNSMFDIYPLDPISKAFDFGDAGSILTLNSNINVVDGKKIRGNVDINSALVRGNIISGGTVNVASGTVRGYITAEDKVTIDGNSIVNGSVYANPLEASGKILGRIVISDRPLYETQEECDGLKVTDLVNGKIATATTNNNNSTIPVAYLNPNTRILSATGTSRNPVTINFGQDNTETTYYLSSANIGENVNINVNGIVNFVMNGNFSMLSDKTKLTIANNASLRIYTAGGMLLDKAQFNYSNNQAKPTSLIIYSSASDGNTVPSVNDAKIQLAAPNTIFRGLVYAPKAYVRVKSNNSLYGSLRGKWIRMEANTKFTYDKAAGTIDAEKQGYRLSYWSEPPYDNY